MTHRPSLPRPIWSQRRTRTLGAAATAALFVVSACGDERPSPEIVSEVEVVEAPGGLAVVEWTVFENANSSLLEAERQLVRSESHDASEALRQAATHITLIAESAGTEDARRLHASAQELRTLATDFPTDIVLHRKVLGEVEGRALIALARHHLLAVERFVTKGDGALAGRHLLTATNDMAEAYRVSDVGLTGGSETALDAAREAALSWMNGPTPDAAAAGQARRLVRDEAERLANALGALHR